MLEINKIIRDLWQISYQGKDISTIIIKSDVQKNSVKRGSRKKSFNYRIVFLTNRGKELDMKGRCSMGQRVLASIVIRLALANAFCTKCDILALDEPTTNLDRKHIRVLAEQLRNLIEDRLD